MQKEIGQAADVDLALADTVASLRPLREQIVAELTEIAARGAQLRESLARIDAVLKRLDPSAIPAETRGRGRLTVRSGKNKPSSERVVALATRAGEYVEQHAADLAKGFTVAQLGRRLRAEGIGSSSYSMREAVEYLRDGGMIRADRKTTGGGVLYVPMANGSDPRD